MFGIGSILTVTSGRSSQPSSPTGLAATPVKPYSIAPMILAPRSDQTAQDVVNHLNDPKNGDITPEIGKQFVEMMLGPNFPIKKNEQGRWVIEEPKQA
jgi:hypothetical protein